MAVRLSRKEKIDKALVDIINKMFEIAGHDVSYEDIKDKEKWFEDYTMTESEYDEWKLWGKKYLQKSLKMNSKLAEKEMSWVGLMFSLKFKD